MARREDGRGRAAGTDIGARKAEWMAGELKGRRAYFFARTIGAHVEASAEGAGRGGIGDGRWERRGRGEVGEM